MASTDQRVTARLARTVGHAARWGGADRPAQALPTPEMGASVCYRPDHEWDRGHVATSRHPARRPASSRRSTPRPGRSPASSRSTTSSRSSSTRFGRSSGRATQRSGIVGPGRRHRAVHHVRDRRGDAGPDRCAAARARLPGPDHPREPRRFRIRDIATDPRRHGFPPITPTCTASSASRSPSGAQSIGNLYLTDKIGAAEFSEDDQRLVETFALHAAIAIENARAPRAGRAARGRRRAGTDRRRPPRQHHPEPVRGGAVARGRPGARP